MNLKNQPELVKRALHGRIYREQMKYSLRVDGEFISCFISERLSESEARDFEYEYAVSQSISASGVKIERVMNTGISRVIPHMGKAA